MLCATDLDGPYFDRWTLKRARKVLSRANPIAHMDLHCANVARMDSMAGNASVLLGYMQHLPFLSSLWIGEGFCTSLQPKLTDTLTSLF